MSLTSHWKLKAVERMYKRMGILVDGESLTEKIHVLVTEFSLVTTLNPGKLPHISQHDYSTKPADQRAWCRMFYWTNRIAEEKRTPIELKVKSYTPGHNTCNQCDELMYRWMKERGL